MLVRDAPDLRVFMLRRNFDSVWIAGASVFPGGAIDDADRHESWEARTRGIEDARASAALGLASGGLGFFVGAIRETFEEAGVLLAHAADGSPTDGRFAHLVEARDALNAGTMDFATFVADHNLILATDELHVFSHWVTPPGSPRRYDTWFFVAAAPPGRYEHDNAELIASAWIRPADALAAADRGEMDLVFPTRKSLEVLADFASAADVLDAARGARRADATGRIRFVDEASGGRRIALPGDPIHDDGALPCPT
jgi:8-oxo-dGTP pyrophosphatase MutT (NUDIX family)